MLPTRCTFRLPTSPYQNHSPAALPVRHRESPPYFPRAKQRQPLTGIRKQNGFTARRITPAQHQAAVFRPQAVGSRKAPFISPRSERHRRIPDAVRMAFAKDFLRLRPDLRMEHTRPFGQRVKIGIIDFPRTEHRRRMAVQAESRRLLFVRMFPRNRLPPAKHPFAAHGITVFRINVPKSTAAVFGPQTPFQQLLPVMQLFHIQQNRRGTLRTAGIFRPEDFV